MMFFRSFVLLLVLLFFPLGLVLIIRGWLGRVVNDHPYCRACGFDLVGSPSDRQQCPECGHNLLNHRAVRQGMRVKRRGLLLAGLMVLLIPLLPLGMSVVSQVTQVNLQQYKPIWLLRTEAMHSSAAVGKAALVEITRRISQSSITTLSQVNGLIDETLRRQTDMNQPWEPAWGEVVEVTHGMGMLDQARWEQYLRQVVLAGIVLELRPRVRIGDPIPYRLRMTGARCGSQARYWLELSAADPMIGSVTPKVRQFGGMGSTLCSTSAGHSGSIFRLSSNEWASLSASDQPLPVKLQANFKVSNQHGGTVQIDFKHTLTAQLQIVPADQPTVKAVHDAALQSDMEKAVKVMQVEETRSGELSMMVELKNPPTGVAYQVVAHVGDQPFKLGSVNLKPNGQTQWHVSGDVTLGEADKVDIELVPSGDVAINTVDVVEYWGEPMWFRDVPVKRLPPQTPTQAQP